MRAARRMGMKAVRTTLAVLICLCAFWGAAHVGVLLPHGKAGATGVQAGAGASQRVIDLRRYLPVIR